MGKKNDDELEPKRKGRPPAKKNPVGRPKGSATIMKEYQQRMLNSPKSRKVLDSIFNAALDDDHKNQASAWKIIVDRIMPQQMFEQEVIKNGGGNKIEINITGVGETKVSNVNEIQDVDYEDVTDEDKPSD